MIHIDVEKVGRIPDGGGWRIHGVASDQKRVAERAKTAGAKAGYAYPPRPSMGSPEWPAPRRCQTSGP